MRIAVIRALCALPFALLPLAAQEALKAAAASPYQSVVGTVENADLAKKAFTVKPDKGDSTTVKFDERTAFLRIPAGETDMSKAAKAAAADVSVGDRILARVWTDSPTGKPATRFVITKQADLAQRQQKTLEEWQTQSVLGVVSAMDSGAKSVTMKARVNGAPKDVTVDLSGRVNYERYNGDTGKYEAVADGSKIAAGDQLRVLGAKSADGSSIKADAVQSAAIKTIPAQIRTLDTAGMQIAAIDPGTKKPVTITVKPYTTIKRLDDMTALMLARRLNPTFQQAGAGRGGRGGAPAGAQGGGGQAPAAAGGPGGNGAGRGGMMAGGPGGPGGFGGGRGGFGGGRGGMDPAKIIEQQPNIQFADLKPNEPLIVTAVASDDPSKLTAISLIAGVDPILRAAPNNGADPLGGGWNFGGGGGGEGGGQ